jgi:hypothetical protein
MSRRIILLLASLIAGRSVGTLRAGPDMTAASTPLAPPKTEPSAGASSGATPCWDLRLRDHAGGRLGSNGSEVIKTNGAGTVDLAWSRTFTVKSNRATETTRHPTITPSFLYLLPHGLSDPEQPHGGSWGGRFEAKKKTNVRSSSNYEIVNPLLDRLHNYQLFSDASDRWTHAGQPYHNEYATVFRWRQAFQNDFAARMDWCVADDFKNANHSPFAMLNGDRTKRVLQVTAKPGDIVTLSAEGTQDPDGDALDVRWWIYPEAGTLPTGADGKLPVTLSAEQGSRTTLVAPKVGNPETLHVILVVRDAGTPPLFAYRRAVITIQP